MGALTSKPYAFVARAWELKSIESIDVFDSYLSSIRYDYRGNAVMRILPSVDFLGNQEWITDKVRFYYDAVQHQRLASCWVRGASALFDLRQNGFFNSKFFEDNAFHSAGLLPTSWSYALGLYYSYNNLSSSDSKSDLYYAFGSSLGLRTLHSFKDFLNCLDFAGNQPTTENMNDFRSDYSVNRATLVQSDLCIFIGVNPRFESPLLNLELKNSVDRGYLTVFNFGFNYTSNFTTYNAGNSLKSLKLVLDGRSSISQLLKQSISPSILISGNLNESIRSAVSLIAENFFKKLNLNTHVLYPFAASIAGAELGLESSKMNFTADSFNLYLANNDEYEINNEQLEQNDSILSAGLAGGTNFVTYIGSHGDSSVNFSNLVLPATTPSELNEIFVSSDLRVRLNRVVLTPDLSAVRAYPHIFSLVKNFTNRGEFINSGILAYYSQPGFISVTANNAKLPFYSFSNLPVSNFALSDFSIASFINEFLLTDTVTRSSQHLALAASISSLKFKNFS